MKVMKSRNFCSPKLSVPERYMQSQSLASMVLTFLIMLLKGANSPKFPANTKQPFLIGQSLK